MKYIYKIQVLFLVVTFLVLSILLFEILNTNVPKQFYCGVTEQQIAEESIEKPVLKPDHAAGEQLFKENCKSCHTLHQESVGPALSGVSKRRPRKWLHAFIQNPARLINKGDTMAVNLYNKYNKAEMTAFPSFSKADIDSLLLYIESVSYENMQYPAHP